MDFFAHQDRARGQTRILLLLFVLALIAIVIAVDAVVLSVVANWGNETGRLVVPDLDWLTGHAGLVALVSLATAAFIALASLFRIATLGGGGGRVVRGLGATLVTPDSQDILRRRLYNVVEEMAIASGVPVPEVYVLEQEAGLNAFAAGFTPGDTAIAVTRGSLETFSRSELQGVIAHEFSHVLNGDMRLNMRLLGILFGILVLSLIGRTILRSMRRARFSSSRSNRGGGMAVALAIGLALAAIGWLGLFFARLIKAAVSRQREYLADASAVQFTRQTEGIAGALKKIAYGGSSLIQDSDGEEVSHMLFANGLRGIFNLYATHPPLEARIRALDPHFDRETYIRRLATEAAADAAAVEAAPNGPEHPETASAQARWNRLMESLIVLTPAAVSASIGNPQDQHIEHAVELRRRIPQLLYHAAHSRSGALLLSVALLLDEEDPVRERQLARLSQSLDPEHLSLVGKLRSRVSELGPAFRLPLMELAFPALRQRPHEQLQSFVTLIDDLISADGQVDSFEYLLSRALLSHLRDVASPDRPATRRRIKLINSLQPLHLLFSVVARLGHRQDDAAARDAYQAGMLAILPSNIDWPAYDPPQHWVSGMDVALETLDRLPALAKQELVKALTATISHDGSVTISEAELLRAVCIILHCPLPPLVAERTQPGWSAAQSGD
ncbi:MAG: M48 family metallopeptidase [Gammaproteobacteria bacterium]|jgi:Zn-dependent protease with chaperone function